MDDFWRLMRTPLGATLGDLLVAAVLGFALVALLAAVINHAYGELGKLSERVARLEDRTDRHPDAR